MTLQTPSLIEHGAKPNGENSLRPQMPNVQLRKLRAVMPDGFNRTLRNLCMYRRSV